MIKAFRGFLVVCCFIVFGIGAVLLRYFVLIFPEYLIRNKEKRLKVCSKILRKSWCFFIKLLEFLKIIKLNINDLNAIKNIKNSIIVSTHPSFIDVVIIMSVIPYTTCFAAEKIKNNIFFKGMADLLFILDSKDIQEWEKSAKNMLDSGFNILIFPMGERHKKSEKPKIRKGASLLALNNLKNIEMIKIETSYEFLMKNQNIYEIEKDPVTYNIQYLGSINTQKMFQKYPDNITFKKEVTNSIAKTLYE